MIPSTLIKSSLGFLSLIDLSLAKGLATITPCPDCRPSIAPKPVVISAQYQTISTCEPSTTTVVYPYTKLSTTGTSSSIETVASCSPYAWVSTTIPIYYNASKTSSLVVTTNQPVTFNSLHYTETHSTTFTLPGHRWKSNGTHERNMMHPSTTVKVSHTTIDIRDYCDYNSIGPIAIPGYKGSDLCTDCGPDANSALTQRLTVVSCANKHCTTFNETRIASPKTYSSEGKAHTTATTNTYCPTATPVTAIPGYTPSAYTGPMSSVSSPTGSYPSSSGSQASRSDKSLSSTSLPSSPSPSSASQSTSTATAPAYPESYTGHPTAPSITITSPKAPEPTPTDSYDDGSPDPSADPSGDVGYDHPAPTPYHQGPKTYKVFKRQGLEKPRGRVMKRSGLLFWGT